MSKHSGVGHDFSPLQFSTITLGGALGIDTVMNQADKPRPRGAASLGNGELC